MQHPVTSRENSEIKLFCSLTQQKKHRDKQGLFAVEGAKLCIDALQSGFSLVSLLYTEDSLARYPKTALLIAAAKRTVLICGSLADRISDTKTPQGVFCIFEKPSAQRLFSIQANGRYLLLSCIQDPGNLGAILRTAEAMGIDGVFVSSDSADLYSPKVLRGSMGGVFRVNISECVDLAEKIAALQDAGISVYAAALNESAQIAGKIDFSAGGAILIGNEGSGLADDLIEACSDSIYIPMAGSAQSLNAGVAAGILIWELVQKRK